MNPSDTEEDLKRAEKAKNPSGSEKV